jgi:hypothetical protein
VRRQLEYRHLTTLDYVALDRAEDDVEQARREREAAFYEVLDLLRQAERFDLSVHGVERVRAELYREKLREALAIKDRAGAGYYEALVRQGDPSGELLKDLTAPVKLCLDSAPAGAEVY